MHNVDEEIDALAPHDFNPHDNFLVTILNRLSIIIFFQVQRLGVWCT